MLSSLALLSLALQQPTPTPPPEPAPAPAPAQEPEPEPEPAIATPFAPLAPLQPRVTRPRARKRLSPADVPESVTHRRLVFSNTYGLNLGILSPIPSGELGLFLGSSLLPRKGGDGSDWTSAIGYQLSLSLGAAEDSTYQVSPGRRFAGERLFFHRHHLTLTGYGGARGRLYYAVGGGVWMWMAEFGGFEGQGRLGVRFAVRDDRRLSGVFGGQVRLTGAVQGAPVPQFGLFLGFMVF